MPTPIEQPQQPIPESERGPDADPAVARVSPVLENVPLLGNGQRNGEGAGLNRTERKDGDHRGAELNGMAGGQGESVVTEPAPLSTETPRGEPPLMELAEPAVPLAAVKIKGRPGGVSVELGEGEWDDLIKLLEERLNAAEGFFRGGRVVLEVGPRPLESKQLRQVRRILEFHEMKLGVVRSTSERTLQAALEVGISTSHEEPEGGHEPAVHLPEATPPRPAHYVHRGNLRSGQVLRKTESIVIIGDVNPGAHVISGGDIMIWGRLRGVAYAGADGNRKAVVAALEFAPTQLRIANLTAVAPDPKKSRGFWPWKQEPVHRAEIARVSEGRIVVEPWDDTRPGGPTTLRR
ncbi:MAG TPA: septum site-determining protein MinC [Caldilineaceae bacterium]|nr:septum site-determining protein MinC [Caldilineaceae bacterium]